MKSLLGDLTRVYIEVGRKKVFAGATEWPGWCRTGDDEDSALEALLEIAPRYATVMQAAQIDFKAPPDIAGLVVVERLEGNATTDFGAPNIPPSSDSRPVSEDEYLRLQSIMMACWQALDTALISASGKDLRRGPRGEGRDLMSIVEHVVNSDASDLARLAWRYRVQNPQDPVEELGPLRQAILNALARAALGEVTGVSRWSGDLWTPRRFVRNLAWHTLDHTWEIEDRLPQA